MAISLFSYEEQFSGIKRNGSMFYGKTRKNGTLSIYLVFGCFWFE